MADVFISYSQADKELVSDLASALKTRRYAVWWDEHLRAGQRFDDEIRTELLNAKVVLVIWTPASVKSEYVRMEAGIGFAWDKLVTVRISDLGIGDIPKAFQKLQTPDVSDFDSIVEAVDEKRGTLKKLSLDGIIQSIERNKASPPAPIRAWLARCQQEGLRVIVKRSIMVKGTVPEFGDVNLCTLYQDGTFNTSYIADSAERMGDISIATDYLGGVAALIEGAAVRDTGKQWTWRVDLHGSLPSISTALPKSEEWVALMKRTQQSFIKAAAEKSSD